MLFNIIGFFWIPMYFILWIQKHYSKKEVHQTVNGSMQKKKKKDKQIKSDTFSCSYSWLYFMWLQSRGHDLICSIKCIYLIINSFKQGFWPDLHAGVKNVHQWSSVHPPAPKAVAHPGTEPQGVGARLSWQEIHCLWENTYVGGKFLLALSSPSVATLLSSSYISSVKKILIHNTYSRSRSSREGGHHGFFPGKLNRLYYLNNRLCFLSIYWHEYEFQLD